MYSDTVKYTVLFLLLLLKRQFLLQHDMPRARKCQPVKGITRGLCRRIAATQITWYHSRGRTVTRQRGSILILPAVESSFNLESVGLCLKLLPPLDEKK